VGEVQMLVVSPFRHGLGFVTLRLEIIVYDDREKEVSVDPLLTLICL
jgi:hypothetical protein